MDDKRGNKGDYNAENIEVLDELEAVRERPGMYIGSTDSRGLHHLVYEVVDNSIDESLAGYCDFIDVEILPGEYIKIEDNGRGIPVDRTEDGNSAVETIMTTLHAGGKFNQDSYEVSGGLHGVGVSAVNALSEFLEVIIKREGKLWKQEFKYGDPVTELNEIRDMKEEEETGTIIKFRPDGDIFEKVEFDYNTIKSRLRELAFLNPGLKISIMEKREEYNSKSSTFEYEGGIKEFVRYLNEPNEELHEVIKLEGEKDNIQVDIALQTTDSTQPSIHAFVNNINTVEGGTHMTGFKSSLTRVVNSYAEEKNLLKDLDSKLKGEDIREGITAVISIKHPDPQFEGQTKTKLGNREVEGIVTSIVHSKLGSILRENPDIAETIVERGIQAAEARLAAKKAQEVTRKKNSLTSTSLPGKLADCQTKDSSESELFIVEGDSAGGSAKQGRNRKNQAVIPLKGKILNVEKNRISRILDNNEIESLIKAIGTGIGENFDINDLRYNNIILLTDADVDGAHIRTLLLTFIYRYMKPLIEKGHIYAAQPPLYRIRNNGETYDAMSEEERDKIIKQKCNGEADAVQRFKGLGEMNPEQLAETTMDKENRHLKKIEIGDAAEADRIFSVLMGDNVEPRREFINENSDSNNWIDI